MEKEFVFKKGSVVVETNKGKVRGYAYNGVSVFKAFRMQRRSVSMRQSRLKHGKVSLMRQVLAMCVRFLICQSQLVRCLYRIATGLWMRIV